MYIILEDLLLYSKLNHFEIGRSLGALVLTDGGILVVLST